MANNKYLFVFLIIPFIVFYSCKKEELIAVYIDIDDYPLSYTQQDTIFVKYVVQGTNPDSVCLYENSTLITTQYNVEGLLQLVTSNFGDNTIKAIAYKNGSSKESNLLTIYIHELIPPDLTYIITRNDGEQSYFVGEQLSIDIRPRWSHTSIDDFKKVKLLLNGEIIGVKTSPPFTFETSTIQNSENTLQVELTDEYNRVHLIEHNLEVPVNTPPEIDIGVWYHPDYEIAYYMTVDSIVLSYAGEDNVNVEYIDFYIDNQYHSTDSINSDRFISELFTIDSLSTGQHTVTCIAVDDRNESTTADPLPIFVYKAYEIDEEIIETKTSEDNAVVYAISQTKLMIINPVEEVITSTVNLPFSEPTSIDYVPESSILYIGFKGGEIASWNNSGNFTTITNSTFNNVDDIELDYGLNTAVIISENNLVILNINTLSYFTQELDLVDGSCLSFDENTKRIVVGGKPHSTGNRFYSCILHSDSIQIIDYKRFSDFAYRTEIHSNGNDLIIYSKSSSQGMYKYDIVDFGEQTGVFSMHNPESGALSFDGTRFYSGNNMGKRLFVFDYDNCDIIGDHYIPLHDYEYINNIIPSADMSKVVLTTNTTFYGDVRIVFCDL